MNVTLRRINELIEQKHIKKSDLQTAIGATAASWRLWYINDSLPGTKYIIALAKSLSVTSDYLLGLSDDAQSAMPTEQKMLLETVKDLDIKDIVDIINYAGYVKIKAKKQGKELVFWQKKDIPTGKQ